jgi:hypothetical protein
MLKKKTSITVDEKLWDEFAKWRDRSLLAQNDAIEALMALAVDATADEERRMREALNKWRRDDRQPPSPAILPPSTPKSPADAQQSYGRERKARRGQRVSKLKC